MRILFGAVLFAILIGMQLSPLRAGEVETVRFGVVMSLSGEFSDLGRMHLAGVRMRMAECNREAAKHGFRLEMLIRDDKSNPDLAAEQAWELLSDPKVVGIVGSNAGVCCAAMLPVVRDMGGVFVSPSATNTDIGRNRDGSFRVLYSDDFQGEALARYMRDTLGFTRGACIVNERYAYSRDVGGAFARFFEAAGGRMVTRELYNGRDDSEFQTMLRVALRENPDVVALPVYAGDVGAMLDAAAALGVAPVFCGGDSWEQESVLKKAAVFPAAAYYIGIGDELSEDEEMRKFRRLLRVTTEPHAEFGSSLGYDAMSLLIEGLKKGPDREALRKNMYTLGEMRLVTGLIRITADGIEKAAYIMKAVATPTGVTREAVGVVKP